MAILCLCFCGSLSFGRGVRLYLCRLKRSGRGIGDTLWRCNFLILRLKSGDISYKERTSTSLAWSFVAESILAFAAARLHTVFGSLPCLIWIFWISRLIMASIASIAFSSLWTSSSYSAFKRILCIALCTAPNGPTPSSTMEPVLLILRTEGAVITDSDDTLTHFRFLRLRIKFCSRILIEIVIKLRKTYVTNTPNITRNQFSTRYASWVLCSEISEDGTKSPSPIVVNAIITKYIPSKYDQSSIYANINAITSTVPINKIEINDMFAVFDMLLPWLSELQPLRKLTDFVRIATLISNTRFMNSIFIGTDKMANDMQATCPPVVAGEV